MNDLDRQIDRLLDGDLNEADTSALYRAAAQDPAVADKLTRRAYLHAQLAEQLGMSAETTGGADGSTTRGGATAVATAASRGVLGRIGFALAGLAAGVALAAFVGWSVMGGGGAGDAEPDAAPTVAVLMEERGVRWTDEPIAVGADVPAGRVSIGSGSLSFEMRSGVGVEIDGPADLTLTGTNALALERGVLRARVPNGAEGFRVDGPGGVRVVDLGTAFDMQAGGAGGAGGDRSTVRVREGVVEVTLGGRVERLTDGEGVWVDPGAADVARRVVRLGPPPTIEGDAEFFTLPLDAAAVVEARGRGLRVIEESPRQTLAEALTVTLADPGAGVYAGQRLTSADARVGRLDAGRVVRSYLLAVRPAADSGATTRTDVSITFDEPIVGVVTTNEHLLATDAAFGLPGVDLAVHEVFAFDGSDRFEISADGRTIRVRTATAAGGADQLRVLVGPRAAKPADSLNTPTP